MARTRNIRIAPSVLDADFGRLADQIAAVEQAGADWLHLDIMDGHFVPNLSFGVPVVAGIARHTGLFLDAHLMITDPGKYAPAFAEAGAHLITFHVETVEDPPALIDALRRLGVQVGVALNPGTPAEAVLPFLSEVDLVLVMTVWPGFGGQAFMRECLPKIETLAGHLGAHQTLEVDGGLNRDTIPPTVDAGADTLVVGSAVYGSADPGAAVRKLRQVALATVAAETEQQA